MGHDAAEQDIVFCAALKFNQTKLRLFPVDPVIAECQAGILRRTQIALFLGSLLRAGTVIQAILLSIKKTRCYRHCYDYGVYTSQFPAECNWTVIDPPAIVDETPYKGVYLDRVGCSITAPAYEAASDAHKQAILDAFIFLNSDELNSKIYSVGGMIPYKTEVIENTELSADLGPQWAQFGDISNYASMSLYPDSLLPLEGENFNTVLDSYLRGDLDDLDAVCADLAERYNAAYKELKESGDVDLSQYEYAYDISK